MRKYKNISKNDVRNFVNRHFLSVRETNNGFRVRCPFKNHEHDLSRPAFDIRFDGLYYCHKCQAKGNFRLLKRFFNY